MLVKRLDRPIPCGVRVGFSEEGEPKLCGESALVALSFVDEELPYCEHHVNAVMEVYEDDEDNEFVVLGGKLITRRYYEELEVKEPPYGGDVTLYDYEDKLIEFNCMMCDQESRSRFDMRDLSLSCSECGQGYDGTDFLNVYEIEAFKKGEW